MGLSFVEVADASLFERPFRWRMGLRSLHGAPWLQIDDEFDRDLEEKARIVRDHRDDALAASPASAPACVAVRDLVAAELASAGRGLVTDEMGPLATIARSVQEDVCVLEPVEGEWRLTAGAVCFPTRWSVASKLGGGLASIHDPVPGYGDGLRRPVDRFVERLRPGSPAWRLNWSVVDRPDRRLPAEEDQAPGALPADPANELFVRIERQVLRRIAAPDAVVFSIRIHVWTLGEVLETVPGELLAATLTSMTPDIAHYKDLAGVRTPLAEWLRPRS